MRFRYSASTQSVLLCLCAGAVFCIAAHGISAAPSKSANAEIRAASSTPHYSNGAIPAPVQVTVTSFSVNWGTSGAATPGTGILPWLGISRFNITLSGPASLSPGDITVTGIAVANYGPVSVSGSGTNYSITLAQPINTADAVTITLGNAEIATYTRTLNVLPGDVNGDGSVNAQDLVLVRNAIGSNTVQADINGDGVVNVTDYNLVRLRVGTSIP